jgi:hypothetical protein
MTLNDSRHWGLLMTGVQDKKNPLGLIDNSPSLGVVSRLRRVKSKAPALQNSKFKIQKQNKENKMSAEYKTFNMRRTA